MGAKGALPETRSRLDVDRVDQAKLAGMLAEARTHATGYRVVSWLGMPADDYLDDIAYLDGRMIEDAPMGELTVEPEQVDAERIRESEQNRLDRGIGRFHTGAVHEATEDGPGVRVDGVPAAQVAAELGEGTGHVHFG